MAGTANQTFERTGNVLPDRNLFNLSHTVKGDFRFGELYPVQCELVIPGDVIRQGIEQVFRLAPSIVPFSHEIDVHFWSFFVPFRLLDKNTEKGRFESVISGGLKGTETRDFYRLSDIIKDNNNVITDSTFLGDTHAPLVTMGVLPFVEDFPETNALATRVMAYPLYAYNRIYIDYFADENLESDIFQNADGVYDGGDTFIHQNYQLLLGNWDKDYFTSALPFQQRGDAPAFPVSGIIPLQFGDPNVPISPSRVASPANAFFGLLNEASDHTDLVFNNSSFDGASGITLSGASNVSGNDWVQGYSDLSSAVSFDVATLRLNVAIQRFMERNARAGVRYTEFLKSHFGVSPSDSRLDRSEYCGGTKAHVVISEVMQTAKDSSSQDGVGDYAGHGLVAAQDAFVTDSYRVEEFGVFMTLMMIRPKAGYMQGIQRQWMYGDRYDWPFPEFANLSEQAIMESELYVDKSTTFDGSSPTYDDIFGYQGRYDELRTAHDRVVGTLIDTLDYWHLARRFASVPQLSKEFIKVDPVADDLNRVFQYIGTPESPAYPFIGTIGFNLSMLRPLPLIPEPGLMDHV